MFKLNPLTGLLDLVDDTGSSGSSSGVPGMDGLPGEDGEAGPIGATGSSGAAGAQGDKGGLRYDFSTSTVDADPGVGRFRYNSAVLASITQIFIDNKDTSAGDHSTFIDVWDDATSPIHGYILVTDNANTGGVINVFAITGSVVDGSGYRKIGVKLISDLTGGIPSDALPCTVNFARTGDLGLPGIPGVDGEDGEAGSVGPTGATGSTGATGATGLGTPGLDGIDGTDGEVGPAGPAGSQGSQGSPGPLGPPGFDGESLDDSSPMLGFPSSGGVTDHGALTGLLDDDHTQYLLLAGRAGAANDPIISTSQTANIYGTNQPSTVALPRDLNIEATSDAAKGQVNIKAPTLVHSVTRTGTGTISTLGIGVIGAGTAFQDELSVGDTFNAGGFTRHVGAISSQTLLTVDRAWPTDLFALTAFTYQRPILKFQSTSGTTTGFLTPDDYCMIGATTINSTNQANLSVTGTQPASVSSGAGAEAPRAMYVQGAKGGNSTATDGNGGGQGGRFNLVAGAGGDASGTNGSGGVGGAWVGSGADGGGLSAAGGQPSGSGGTLVFSAGNGGPLTGAASGSTAGQGATATFRAGAGGTAVAGNTRGNGGNLVLRPGLAGTGAGSGGANGWVVLADLGSGCVVGASTITAGSVGLELQSTTLAFIPSRMTTTQRDALTAVDGMLIYNSDAPNYQVRRNGVWVTLPWDAYAPDSGGVTLQTGRFADSIQNLTLSSTQRATLEGTARLVVEN